MRYQLEHQIKIYFTLSDGEFELLNNAILNHNDTAFYATIGNFWYGNVNSRKFHYEESSYKNEDYLHYGSIREFDKMIKSLEPYVNYTLPDKIKQEIGVKLYFTMSKLLTTTLELLNKLNKDSQIIYIQ